MAELPHLVQLHDDHPDDIVCITFNLDYDGLESEPPDSLKPSVRKVLEAIKADCTNIICSDASEGLYKRIELAAVPAVYVYDKTGKMRKRFADGFTYDGDVIPFVEDVLKE